MKSSRRKFIRRTGQYALGMGLMGSFGASLVGCNNKANNDAAQQVMQEAAQATGELFFKISLAQWSLHRALGRRGDAPTMDNLDFAAKAKSFGIDAVEYVSQFFADKADDEAYLGEMNKRAADNGVKNLLIMIDGEGGLGDVDDAKRKEAVEKHHKWVRAAKTLGCHSIRVNAYGEGTADEVSKAAIDGLGQLATFAKDFDINIIVENHGGYSSNGDWMANVISQVGMGNCGMLPDFGNFCIKRDPEDPYEKPCLEEFDRYKGVELFMPTAKAVSAKSHDFDEEGNEIHTDYRKMLKIVKDAGYTGYVGIEYEGSKVGEEEGIKLTKALLEKVGAELS